MKYWVLYIRETIPSIRTNRWKFSAISTSEILMRFMSTKEPAGKTWKKRKDDWNKILELITQKPLERMEDKKNLGKKMLGRKLN